jgi:plasmid stabilization system protein ParE
MRSSAAARRRGKPRNPTRHDVQRKEELSMSAGHGHIDPSNKKIALLIAVLALVLAFSETLGKSAQTNALSLNIEASNLWSFFQAKTIRQTVVRTAAEQTSLTGNSEEAKKQIEAWRKTAQRYQTEPETGEGRDELMARAKEAEKKRDRSMAAYHQYELASAAVQIAIVLASAAIVTGAMALAWIGAGLGVVGVAFCLIGFFAPTSVHVF